MKRIIFLLLLCALLLLLPGCGSAGHPSVAEDGTPWDADWTLLGRVMGVAAPGHDFTLLEYDSALTRRDIFYASWKTGEPTDYTNAEGTEVQLFPAKLYVLLYGCENEAAAAAAMEEWLDQESGTYDIRDRSSGTHNGQNYTVIDYACISDANPYERGASAFGVWNRYAVAVELTATERYDGDVAAILGEILDGVHFSAENYQ